MITFLLIYFSGAILTFFLIRHLRRTDNEFSNDPWEGIWFNLWFPVLSWIGAAISGFIIIKYYVEEHDPPDWL